MHQARIQQLRELVDVETLFAEGIRFKIKNAEAVVIDEGFEEFEADAHQVKAKTLESLRASLTKQEKHEAEQAELERLRAETAAREKKEREERIAREAAERARLEAEQKAQAERQAAERRELELKLQAEQAERARIRPKQTALQLSSGWSRSARQQHCRLSAILSLPARTSAAGQMQRPPRSSASKKPARPTKRTGRASTAPPWKPSWPRECLKPAPSKRSP